MLSRMSTRQRAIFGALFLGLVTFLLISGSFQFLLSLLLPPSSPTNVRVEERYGEIALSWDSVKEFDVENYKIYVDNSEYAKLRNDVNAYLITDLDLNQKNNIHLVATDSTGRDSSRISYVTSGNGSQISEFLNPFNAQSVRLRDNVLYAFGLALIVLLINTWVLFFNHNKKSFTVTGIYPSITLFPFFILGFTLYDSISNNVARLILVLAMSAAFGVLSYVILLTNNILHGSIKSQLPLEQAAKAVQFIFSLISTYLIMIFVLGADIDIVRRLAFILPFIFYYTYSSVWFLRHLRKKDVVNKSVLITLLVGLSIVVVAVWPIDSVYSILFSAVVYYILLNVALENRKKIPYGYWVEYLVLISLSIFILFTTAFWGINGSII
jgi:hypothetical protein